MNTSRALSPKKRMKKKKKQNKNNSFIDIKDTIHIEENKFIAIYNQYGKLYLEDCKYSIKLVWVVFTSTSNYR